MKKQPIHQNLNTSFVNVGALVRYLRGLQFVGSIRIELSSYEAEIIFTESRTVRAREYDHIAGRISHGEHALQRILVRAKEPHGRIHVYKSIEGYAGRDDGSVFVDKKIVTGARELAANPGGAVGNGAANEIVLNGNDAERALVLAVISELFREIEHALATGNLSFAAAFRVACDGIASQFAFLAERRDSLAYRNGEIIVRGNVDANDIIQAVFAALRPIFRRLRGEVKYSELVHATSERILELATERRAEFVRLGLMEPIEFLLVDE